MDDRKGHFLAQEWSINAHLVKNIPLLNSFEYKNYTFTQQKINYEVNKIAQKKTATCIKILAEVIEIV